MKRAIIPFILILILGILAFAQNEKPSCPTIDVAGGGFVQPGEPMFYTVNVSEEAKNFNLEYKWTVSKGIIIEGQGTQTIKVDTIGLSDINLTATVEIKGLPENCANTFSESYFTCPPHKPTLIDIFGKLPDSNIKSRIKEMYIKLGNEPNSQGYIINYGTDKEMSFRENQLRKAISFLKYDASRVTIVRGGRNPSGAGVWTKIWIVPPGAENPEP